MDPSQKISRQECECFFSFRDCLQDKLSLMMEMKKIKKNWKEKLG